MFCALLQTPAYLEILGDIINRYQWWCIKLIILANWFNLIQRLLTLFSTINHSFLGPYKRFPHGAVPQKTYWLLLEFQVIISCPFLVSCYRVHQKILLESCLLHVLLDDPKDGDHGRKCRSTCWLGSCVSFIRESSLSTYTTKRIPRNSSPPNKKTGGCFFFRLRN